MKSELILALRSVMLYEQNAMVVKGVGWSMVVKTKNEMLF
jgi:hypothetical protein